LAGVFPAGLELFTDLVLADYLAATGFAGQLVLHGKALPWFVSDTLTHDLDYLIVTISSSSSEANAAALAAAGKRWASHMESGRWRFAADQFWTTPHPFWWMQEVRLQCMLLCCFMLSWVRSCAEHTSSGC
jgi:hypothetical protein